MKFRGTWLPLLVALALPGALQAQDDDDCPCRTRPGIIGVTFDADGEEGVRITGVRRGSPAERAGLHEGDVVVRLNGEDAGRTMEALPRRLQAGDSVRLRIRRDGGERDVVVVAEPRPGTRLRMVPRSADGRTMIVVDGDSMEVPVEELATRIESLHARLGDLAPTRLRMRLVDSMATMLADSMGVWAERMPEIELYIRDRDFRRSPATDTLIGPPEALENVLGQRPFFMELGRRSAAGAELAEMNEGLSAYFGGQREGALVIEVSPESPAARAGLQPGDVIVRAGGQEVEDPADVRTALTRAENGRVALEVIRQGRRRELSLEWTARTRMYDREVRPSRAPAPPPAPRPAPRSAPRPRGRN